MMKLTLVLIALLFARIAAAQGIGDSLIVNLKNGQRVAIPLSDIRKITFETLGTSDVKNSNSPSFSRRGQGVVFPNPLHSTTTIEFDNPSSAPVTIEIYDDKGSHVMRSVMPAGSKQFVWDGLNDSGAPVQSGTYFFEVHSKDFVQTRKAVVVR